MGICLKHPVCSCYACSKTGNYLTYLAAKLRSWEKAIAIIKEFTPRELKVYEENETQTGVTHVDMPPEATRKAGEKHISYLESRGYDHKELEVLYDLHYVENVGRWANRIIAPIYIRNKLVTFTSIDTEKESFLRYKHLAKELSIIHCKDLLYGLEQAVGKTLIVVEGFFDKLRIGSGAVCTFGTKVTTAQKRLMVGYDKVVVLFDGDKPGKLNGRKLADELAAFTNVELITLDEGVDPDKLAENDIKEIQNMIRKRW
jgi:DNA primase